MPCTTQMSREELGHKAIQSSKDSGNLKAEKEKPRAIIWARLVMALKRLEVKKYFANFALSYFSDEQWVHNNFPVLLEKYPDTWIVVCQEKVIFSHNSREEVDKFMADKGFTSKDVVTRFITNRMPIFR